VWFSSITTGFPVLRGDDRGARPEQLAEPGAISVKLFAFKSKDTTSASATASIESVATGVAEKSPRSRSTRIPCSWIARRCGPRAISVTSAPPLGERRSHVPADRPAPEDGESHRLLRTQRRRCGAGPCPWRYGGSRRPPESWRELECGSELRQCARQLLLGGARRKNHRRFDHLAVFLVVDAEAHRLGDGRMGEQHLVDLAREMFSPPRMIISFKPSLQVQVTVGEHSAVAGPKPAIAKRRRVGFVVSKVTRSHAGAGDHDLAGRARRRVDPLIIDGRGPAHRALSRPSPRSAAPGAAGWRSSDGSASVMP